MRLVAPERWLAGAVIRRQTVARSARVVRVEARYGTDGVRLLAAAMGSVIAGELVVIAGLAFLAVSSTAAWSLIGLGVALIALSSIRFRQGARAGREFRQSSRP